MYQHIDVVKVHQKMCHVLLAVAQRFLMLSADRNSAKERTLPQV